MQDRLARGAVWLVATRLIVNLIGFLSTIVLSRLLFPADFGLVAIAVTVQALVGSITELSTSSAIIRHDNPNNEHFDSVFTLNVIRSGILALLLAASAHFIAAVYGDKRLVAIMFTLGATTMIGGLFNPKIAIFSRNFIFWQEFALGVPQKLIGLFIAVVIAAIYQSYWALIIGAAASQLTGLVISYMLAPYWPVLGLAKGREFMNFSVWIMLERTVGALNIRAVPLIIGYFLGSVQLGYYSFGDNFAALPTREATAPISGVLLPAFSQLKHDFAKLRETYQQAQTLLCAIALPIGFGLATIAHPLIILVVGEKWMPSVIVIEILAGVFAIDTLWASVWPIALALGQTRELFHREVFNLVLRIPLVFAGMYLGGLIGVLIARLISGLVMMVLNLSLVDRLIGLSVHAQVAANYRTILGTIVMTIALVLLQQSGPVRHADFSPLALTVILVMLGACIYIATVGCLWLLAERPLGPEATIFHLFCNILRFHRKFSATTDVGAGR